MNIVVIDTETTGLIAGVDEVLQISAIDGNGRTLLNALIRPEHTKSWPEAEVVNGITPERVKFCPTISDYKTAIAKIISNSDLFIGYNLKFDLKMLVGSGINLPSNLKTSGVMLDFAEIYGEWNDYYGCYKWQKLKVMTPLRYWLQNIGPKSIILVSFHIFKNHCTERSFQHGLRICTGLNEGSGPRWQLS